MRTKICLSGIAAVAVATMLASCASTITPKVQARLANAVPDSPIACGGCKAEWERSQLWLSMHSTWKLQLATDVALQTFNPTNYDVSYGFQVLKIPQPDGGYLITMSATCGNPLGCDPLPADVRRAFYHYVATGVDVLAGAGYLGSIR